MNKFTRVLVAGAIGATALVGCGSSGGSSSRSSNETATESSSTVESETSAVSAPETSAETSSASDDSAAVASAPADAYLSLGGDFTVDFPSSPIEETQTQNLLGVDVDYKLAGTELGGDRFIVITSDMAELVEVSGQSLESQLDDIITGFVGAAGGETTSNDSIDFEGHEARRYEFEATGVDGPATGVGLVIANGDVLYQVVAYGTDPASQQEFVDSFHFTETAAD